MKLKVVKLSEVVIKSTKEEAVLLVAQNESANTEMIFVNPPIPHRVSLGDMVEVGLKFTKPEEP